MKCNITCVELFCKDCQDYLFPQMKTQAARWSGCWAPLVSSKVTLHVPWGYSKVPAWLILWWLRLWQVTLSGATFSHQDGSDLPPPTVTHFCMNSFSIPSIWPSNAGRISFALLYALFLYWAVFDPHPKKSHPETLIKIFSFWQKHLQGAGKKGQLVKHLSCKPEDLSSNLNSHMKRWYSPEILALGMQWQADAWSCRHSQISEVQIQ